MLSTQKNGTNCLKSVENAHKVKARIALKLKMQRIPQTGNVLMAQECDLLVAKSLS